MNINVNFGSPNTTIVKSCPRQHSLTMTQGNSRNFPLCNGCGSKCFQMCYTCYTCNYDVCELCFHGQTGNASSFNTGNFNNISTQSSGNFSTARTCLRGHGLFLSSGINRRCDQCSIINQQSVYNCGMCSFDLCLPCYQGGSNMGYNNNMNMGYNSNINMNTNMNMNTGYNQGYSSNNNMNMNMNTGYNQYNPYQNQTSNMVITTNPYNPYQNQTNMVINTNPYNPFQSTVMTTSTQCLTHKTCQNNHYLTLCDSTTRFNPTCNICRRPGLNNSWCCFSCDFDMCLTCYDQNCQYPTKSLKFCRKRHSLLYADSTTRGFRRCDKCFTSNLLQSYCCYACNYDLCLSCYNNWQNEGSCTIF